MLICWAMEALGPWPKKPKKTRGRLAKLFFWNYKCLLIYPHTAIYFLAVIAPYVSLIYCPLLPYYTLLILILPSCALCAPFTQAALYEGAALTWAPPCTCHLRHPEAFVDAVAEIYDYSLTIYTLPLYYLKAPSPLGKGINRSASSRNSYKNLRRSQCF